jgi:hypothetical protein
MLSIIGLDSFLSHAYDKTFIKISHTSLTDLVYLGCCPSVIYSWVLLTLALRNFADIIPQLLHGDAISYVIQRKKHPPVKTNGETKTRYEPGLGALRRERRASPPKYKGQPRQPADYCHTEEAEAQQVCGHFIGLQKTSPL